MLTKMYKIIKFQTKLQRFHYCVMLFCFSKPTIIAWDYGVLRLRPLTKNFHVHNATRQYILQTIILSYGNFN